MLSDRSIDAILAGIPRLSIAVVGDLFLDRYLDLDSRLTEVSVETGLDAYQVVRVRSSPGAAGTVINNLVALGVKRILPMAVIGDDGEGYELRTALGALGVDARHVAGCPTRRTPTYTKPMLDGRELNRLDIKNRSPLPRDMEETVLDALLHAVGQVDALIVVDQVAEAECGVVTTNVREALAELGARHPKKVILADSRDRVGLFRDVWLKPNQAECTRALNGSEDVRELAKRAGRPVFCTRGERGITVVDPRNGMQEWEVPAFKVNGVIDPVGAGDSTSAAIACALATGASIPEAAAFGNLVASITIQQIGTTGTATPAQVRGRWVEFRA